MAVSTRSAVPAGPNSARSRDLTIDPSGALRAGRAMMTFVPGDERSFLVAYLKLVRWLRHQKSAPAIVLRRTEIELLADHLGADPADILERLGALMGATVTQRRALVAAFATGTAVIFLAVGASAATGGGAISPTSPTSTTPARDAAPPAMVVDESPELHDALSLVVITSAPHNDDPADDVADVVSAPNLAPPGSAPPSEPTAGPAAATAPVAIPPTAAVDDTAVAGTMVPAPAEVAVGEPPVPTPPVEVAVGEPPVPTPPVEVAVGEPPVPTPPGR